MLLAWHEDNYVKYPMLLAWYEDNYVKYPMLLARNEDNLKDVIFLTALVWHDYIIPWSRKVLL